MNKIIKFFKENYEKDGSVLDLAIKFHNIFLGDDCYGCDEVFRICLLYIMCNLNVIHIDKEDFRIFTNDEIFKNIAESLYNYKNFDVMEIE